MTDSMVKRLNILGCCTDRIEYILYKKGFINIGGDFIWSKGPIDGKGITKDLSNVTYENYIAALCPHSY